MIFSADTGGGKSTQIPRMLMYYTNCFKPYTDHYIEGLTHNSIEKLYQSTARIACT